MADLEKSNAELLQELIELRQEFTFLKSLYEKEYSIRRQQEKDNSIVEQRLRTLSAAIDQSPVTTVITDLAGDIVFVNPKFTQTTGYTSDEVLGKNPRILKTGNTPPEVYKELWATLTAGKSWYGILQNRKKNGDLYWESAVISPVKDTNGVITHFLAVKEDITQRKLADEVLLESKANLAAIIENTSESIWSVNTAYEIVYLNSVFSQSFYVAYGVLLEPGMNILKALNVSVSGAWKNHYDRVFNRERIVFEELFVLHNKVLTIEIAMNPILLEGRIIGASVFSRNITQRKQDLEDLRQSEERLRLSLEATHQGLYDLNVQTGETVVNDEYALMLGYDPRTFIETNAFWIERLHPDDKEITAQAYADYIEGRVPVYRVEFRQLHLAQQWKWILSVGKITEYDVEGKPLRMLGTHVDITEQKKADQALLESQRFLSDIIENNGAVIYAKDLQGRYELVNKQWEIVTGLLHDFVIGKTDAELFPGRISESFRQSDLQVVDQGVLLEIEEFLESASGVRYFISKKFPLKDQYNNIKGVCGMSAEITQRKEMESKLRESEQRYRLLIESANEGILVGQGGMMKFVNPMMVELTGYSEIQLLSTPFIEFIFPDDRELVIENHQKRIHDLPVEPRYHFRLLCHDNSIKWVEMSGVKIDWEGQAASINFVGDITERKLAEDALKESEAKFKTIIETSPDGIAISDLDGYILFATSKAVSMWGYDYVDEVVGQNITQFIDQSYHEAAAFYISEILHGNSVGANEFLMVRSDGSSFFCEANANLLRDANNNPLGILYIERDISERKIAEQEIQHKNEELIGAIADKDRFITILGHDLKSPFHALFGFSQMLSHNVRVYDLDTIENMAYHINKSAENAFHLLEDILIWASLKSGKTPFQPQIVAFDGICQSIFENLNFNASAKDISTTYFVIGDIELFADVNMLKTILRNLVSNAIKFTNSGGKVHITAEQNNNHVLIIVSDNGVGIDAEVLGKLFDISQKSNTKGTFKEEGTGLGLILCKDFVEKHGGSIWVESQVGIGSKFKILLPNRPVLDSIG